MENLTSILWVILGVVLMIAEIFTLGFVLFWFGIGALLAAITAYLGFGYGIQFLSFAVTAVVLTALSRQIFLRSEHPTLKTGIDALPGQIGTVTGASKGSLNSGEVKVYGSTWTAFPLDGEEPLKEGEKVEVVSVKGSSIFVRRYLELAEWREN